MDIWKNTLTNRMRRKEFASYRRSHTIHPTLTHHAVYTK